MTLLILTSSSLFVAAAVTIGAISAKILESMAC